MRLDRRQLDQIAEGLGLGFYLVIAGSLFAVVIGSPGWAFLQLIVAGAAHVGRAGIEEFVAAAGEDAHVVVDLGAAREQVMARVSRLRTQPAPRRTSGARRRR